MNRDFGNASAMMIVEAPMPQPDVRDERARAQLRLDAVERGQQRLHEVAEAARAEEALDAVEQARE